MPTTYTDLVPVRRVAVGDCAGPLGSGFDALARSAYNSLLAAPWTESSEPPMLPVHDNGQTANRGIPHGDAWKCTYGYDKAARTERSACGAVCYSYALPADATAGTAANIATVSLSLTGDRYLDLGVDLYLIPSASAEPPSIPDILALTPAGTYCATSDQSPTPPNQRAGVTATVSAAPGVAAQPYLHVALLLHDYVTNRGAWIEGGAMLDGGVSIAFSRSVAVDTPPDARLLLVTCLATTGATSAFSDTPCAFSVASFLKNSYNPTSFASDDVKTIVGLAYAGRSPDSSSAWYFTKPEDFGRIKASCLETVSASTVNINTVVYAFAYHSLPLVAGMEIEMPEISGTAGNKFRAALVQHSLVAAPGTEYTVTSLANIPAFDQVLAGSGPDVIAVADGEIDANGTASPTLVVAASPSKPYVSLVLFPLEIGVDVSAIPPPILVASMPSNA